MAAAAIINGVLKDHGIITENDRHEVVDSSKIGREKKRVSKAVKEEREEHVQNLRQGIPNIYEIQTQFCRKKKEYV